jgi:HD-GYP domain-containing protein (c-di-GMP phosphodiesterase class II)
VASKSRESLNRGVAAAHSVLVRVFEKLRAGMPLAPDDIMQAEARILKALKRSSLKEWVLAVSRHHNHSYRHCLLVTGFAVAFGQHLGMREEDQRRLARAGLVHDVGKTFIPLAVLNKAGPLTAEEEQMMRDHTRRGFEALSAQSSFPREMLDVVLHHHEYLDGTGYPDRLRDGEITDIPAGRVHHHGEHGQQTGHATGPGVPARRAGVLTTAPPPSLLEYHSCELSWRLRASSGQVWRFPLLFVPTPW